MSATTNTQATEFSPEWIERLINQNESAHMLRKAFPEELHSQIWLYLNDRSDKEIREIYSQLQTNHKQFIVKFKELLNANQK